MQKIGYAERDEILGIKGSTIFINEKVPLVSRVEILGLHKEKVLQRWAVVRP